MNRRLRILPEVLPAPTRAAQSDVRARTMAHMQRLLATAAVLPLACTKADTQPTQTVTIPAANGTASGTTADTNQVSLIPETHPSASATPTATAPVDVGYAVVDPMPAPARCMGLAAASRATATFTADATGPVLDVHLALPTGGAWSGTTITPPGPPSVWGGQIISSSMGPNHTSQTVRVRPTGGGTSLGVSFTVSCTAGTGTVAVTASYTSTNKGSKVALASYDY